MVEIANEKAIKARIPEREKAGSENQYDEKPLKVKLPREKPGTTKVTR